MSMSSNNSGVGAGVGGGNGGGGGAGGGDGRIGVQLASNADLSHRLASSPLEAAGLASKDFVRLGGQVVMGLKQIVTNFNKTAENISGKEKRKRKRGEEKRRKKEKRRKEKEDG